MRNQDIKQWHQEQFMPWKQAMEKHLAERKNLNLKLKHNATELKYIAALLLEQRTNEALALWNELGLEPKLADLQIDYANKGFVMVDAAGNQQKIALEVLMNELQSLLKG